MADTHDDKWSWMKTFEDEYPPHNSYVKDVPFVGGLLSGGVCHEFDPKGKVYTTMTGELYYPVLFHFGPPGYNSSGFLVLIHSPYLNYLQSVSPHNPDGTYDLIGGIFNDDFNDKF